MADLSKACRDYLAARFDEGGDLDARFQSHETQSQQIAKPLEMRVIELDIEDIQTYPELRGYTAVAISQDGSVAYLTKEEADDGNED